MQETSSNHKTSCAPGEQQPPGDGDLLRQFRATRDADAFAEIVTRFTPMVLGVATRSLQNPQSVEDVFQATFLVLARDAEKIRTPESLAAWLYGTTLRVSRRANLETRWNWPVEDIDAPAPHPSPFEAIHKRFQQEVIDEELERLPERYRTVLVLHIVEGKTCEQAAAAMGTSVGAVRGFLQRGKRDFRLRLLRRGILGAAAITAIGICPSAASAAARTSLATTTVQGSVAQVSGAAGPWCSLHATQLAAMETVMYSSFSKLLTTAALLLATVTLGWFAGTADAKISTSPTLEAVVTSVPEAPVAVPAHGSVPSAENAGTLMFVALPARAPQDETETGTVTKPAKATLLVEYGDGKPDGKKSIAGTGKIIRFTLPDETQKLRGLKVHCARYGYPQAPRENVQITIVDEAGETVHQEAVPYGTFKRGESKWTTIRFKKEATVPRTFSAIMEFNAGRTKGVYVSYDSSTDGKHSKTGVPGYDAKDVSFEGDWMVQAILTRPK